MKAHSRKPSNGAKTRNSQNYQEQKAEHGILGQAQILPDQ